MRNKFLPGDYVVSGHWCGIVINTEHFGSVNKGYDTINILWSFGALQKCASYWNISVLARVDEI